MSDGKCCSDHARAMHASKLTIIQALLFIKRRSCSSVQHGNRERKKIIMLQTRRHGMSDDPGVVLNVSHI